MPLLHALANLGIRAPELDAEVAFLEALGATGATRVRAMRDGAVLERVRLSLGGTPLALFRAATYDDALEELGEARGGGVAHVAFHVENLDAVVTGLAGIGVTPLAGPFASTSPDGVVRRVAFYRSPNGTIVEPQQTDRG